MIKVGLTGGIGSGKSIVARIFQVLGIPVYNSDEAARELMGSDQELIAALSDRFGASIYIDEKLDRKKLGSIVFNDPKALEDLNSLVHPAVRKAFAEWADQQNSPYVLMESAILAESGGHRNFDRMIVVSAPEELRIERVMKRDGMGEGIVRAWMRNQTSEEERLKIADHVIVNDDRQLVIPQVLAIHQQLLERD